jgi:hypothetical protein
MRKIGLALAATAALFASAPAIAGPVVVNQWYSFNFLLVGPTFIAGQNGDSGTNPASINADDPNWTFDLLTAGSITFVDAFLSGDQFQITDNGLVIGSTSAPTNGDTCGADITACLSNPNLSSGTFALGAGSHSINGSVLVNAPQTTGGGGFFRINGIAAVPEASTWAMMLLGFGGIGVTMRRRRRVPLARVA